MANNFGNSINSNIGASNSGATNTLTITNPSNTASSQALLNVTVGGATAGDAFTTYTVNGVTNWSQGIDNSASDAFVISASTALGTTNVVSMATGGNVSVVLGDLDVTRSNSGANVTSTISNTSNTATSNAIQQITVAGTSANDPFTTYTISGTTNWSQGIDNSVTGDPYILSASTALGTTNVMSATTAGSVTKPLQPAFLAILDTTDTNATGNGATYTLGGGNALTIIFDQQSNMTTGGVFTAPVTGRYQLSFQLVYAALTAAMTSVTGNIVVSNRIFGGGNINIGLVRTVAAAADMGYTSRSVLADMDAADTFTVVSTIAGGAGNTASVSANAARVFMSGFLAC